MAEAFDPAGSSATPPPAEEDEVVYFEGSPLMRGEVARTLGLMLGGAAIFLFPLGMDLLGWWSAPWWVIVIFMVVGAGIAALPYLLVRTVHYRVTNYRIDFERGLLTKAIDTLELWHVDDIGFRQSLMARMLGVGTITIISDDATTPRLDLHGLPRPRPLFEQLKQRVIAVKRQRGVIKMDMGGGGRLG